MPKKKACSSCCFWRDKGWANNQGIGKCDNPNVIKQVTVMSESLIERFVLDKRDARFIATSLRFRNDFCCIHHKPLKNKKNEV